jgi:hypothetical protein
MRTARSEMPGSLPGNQQAKWRKGDRQADLTSGKERENQRDELPVPMEAVNGTEGSVFGPS